MTKNTPTIRFAGFTDAWEQRKLSEMSDFITKGATPTTYGFEWVDEGIPFFRNDAIKDNQFVYGDFSYISEEANEALSRSEITADDILVAITGDIGKVGIVPQSIKKANINQHTARVRIVNDAVPYFVYQSLAREEQQRIYQKIKTGLSMPQLSLEQIRDTLIFCPSYEEQTRIANVLYNLDNLITLHQRKYDELQLFKKSLLQKMFPMDGETKPEIRFAGYTDAWEQRKFGEILVEFSNKSKTENEYPVLSSTNTGMEFRDGRVSGMSNVGYKIIDYNDLVLSPQNLWLGNININDIGIGIVSPSYKTYKLKNIVTDFFRPQIRTTNLMKKYFNSSIQGASVVRRNLDVEKFNDINIFVPSASEQVTIGCFFRNLDNLITLHQRKLEQLKNVKKVLLQNMFV